MALLLGVAASGELLSLLSRGERQPIRWLVYAGNFLIVAANAVPAFGLLPSMDGLLGRFEWPVAALAIAALAAFVGEIARYKEPGWAAVNLSLTIFSFVYVGLLLTFVTQIAFGANGLVALLSLVIVVKMGDNGSVYSWQSYRPTQNDTTIESWKDLGRSGGGHVVCRRWFVGSVQFVAAMVEA